MTSTRLITAEGKGLWGGKTYDVQLFTSSATYFDAAHKNARTVVGFGLSFASQSSSDMRGFESEDARAAFLKESFSSLFLKDIPISERKEQSVDSPLQSVVGEYLSSVTFVMDYLQLDFCGYGFNMYSWPLISIGGRTFAYSDPGYRDALCSLIGRTLDRIDEYLDKGLTFQFAEESCINLPLQVGMDFRSPEIAEFRGHDHEWVVWQVGEEPFDSYGA